MDIYAIAEWSTGFAAAFTLYLLCETFMTRRKSIKNYIYALSVVVLGVVMDIISSMFSMSIINILVQTLWGIIYSFLYVGKKTRVLLPVFNIMLATLTEVFVFIIMTVIFNEDPNVLINSGNMRLIGIAASKIFLIAIVVYAHLKYRHNPEFVNTGYWRLSAILSCISIMIMYTLFVIIRENPGIFIRVLSAVCSFGMLIAVVIILRLYENSFKKDLLITKNEMSTLRLKEEIKHYNDIMMTQGQVKKLKHDLENHLLSIEAMIKKGEYEKCLEYIDALRNNTDLGASYIDTGNTVLDALISAKKTEAERLGVKFNMNIRVPKMLPVSDEDECVIFGNALDNAVEAASRAPGEKYVNLSLAADRDRLICRISNSCEAIPDAPTSKDDFQNHGIGKYNMRDALKKYNSVSRASYENGEYTLSIILMGLDIPE